MKISNVIHKPISDINITPMVDVFLVLLIIFMVTASMITNKTLRIDVPESTQAEDLEVKDFIQIEVFKNRNVAINGKKIEKIEDLAPMIAKLASKKPDILVNIQADKNIDIQTIVKIIDTAKSVKIKSVTIQTAE